MSTVKAFLIEPMAETIRPVMIDPENRHAVMSDLLDCLMTDFVRLESGHVIFADFNGLKESLPCLTEIVGGPAPLAGNLLFARMDEKGELVDVTEEIESVARRFTIVRPYLHSVIETVGIADREEVYITSIEIQLGRSIPEAAEVAEG